MESEETHELDLPEYADIRQSWSEGEESRGGFNRPVALTFFRTLWGDTPSKVYLSLKEPDRGDVKGRWVSNDGFNWPEDRHKICRYAKQNRDAYDVYMTPATFTRDAEGRKEEFALQVHTLWIDLDKNQVEGAREFLEDHGGFVVDSGTPGNYHGYIPLDEPTNPARAKALNGALKELLGGDHKESTSTVLRVPFTKNHKPGSGDVFVADPGPGGFPSQSIDTLDEILGGSTEDIEEVEDFDLTVEDVGRIPSVVQHILDLNSKEAGDAYEEGRSGAFYHLVTTAIDFGLTPGQIAGLLLTWDVALKKFRSKKRILSELQRVLKKYYVEIHEDAESGSSMVIDSTEIDDYPMAPFMIQNLLPEGGFSLLTGHSGTGKSFIAVDLAARVAYGMEYAGRKTKKGKVLYIAMEGQAGVVNRVRAWYRLNQITPQPDHFKMILRNFSFVDEKIFGRLLADIRNEQPRLILLDTVAHAMSGWEENSATEMSAFVSRVSEIESVCGATVLLIHHQAKSSGKGEGPRIKSRGSGALPAAANAVMETDKQKGSANIRVEFSKQKDIEHPEPLQFRLESVDFQQVDEFGDVAPQPAVAVYEGAATDDETKLVMAVKEIYNNFLENKDRDPVSKTNFIEKIIKKTGSRYVKYSQAWDELVEWSILQEHPRGQWTRCDLAPNHVSRYQAWVESPMMKADPGEEGTD